MAAAELTVVLVPRDSAALGEDPARIAGGRDSERSHQGNNISHFFLFKWRFLSVKIQHGYCFRTILVHVGSENEIRL